MSSSLEKINDDIEIISQKIKDIDKNYDIDKLIFEESANNNFLDSLITKKNKIEESFFKTENMDYFEIEKINQKIDDCKSIFENSEEKYILDKYRLFLKEVERLENEKMKLS